MNSVTLNSVKRRTYGLKMIVLPALISLALSSCHTEESGAFILSQNMWGAFGNVKPGPNSSVLDELLGWIDSKDALPDVVMLQEVCQDWNATSGGLAYHNRFHNRGYWVAFVSTDDDVNGCPAFGNFIAVKGSVVSGSYSTLAFVNQDPCSGETRKAMRVSFNVGGVGRAVATAHLLPPTNADRRVIANKQAKELHSFVRASSQLELAVGGDFNLRTDRSGVVDWSTGFGTAARWADVSATPPARSPQSVPTIWERNPNISGWPRVGSADPNARIDYIWIYDNDFDVHPDWRRRATNFSDHYRLEGWANPT